VIAAPGFFLGIGFGLVLEHDTISVFDSGLSGCISGVFPAPDSHGQVNMISCQLGFVLLMNDLELLRS
jgi:hypothetical protein